MSLFAHAAALTYLGYRQGEHYDLVQLAHQPITVDWLDSGPQPDPADIAAAELPGVRAILLDRITAERNRRSDLVITGSTDRDHVVRSQLNMLMAATGMLNAARGRPLTADEDGLVATMVAIPAFIKSLDAAADALLDWAVATVTDPADLDTLDVTSPPAEAPQWPV